MSSNALCLWMTGPTGAGSTTVGRAVVEELRQRGRAAALIDVGEVDQFLSATDPHGAVLWLAELLVECDTVAVISVPAPVRDTRDRARDRLSRFAEIFIDPDPPGRSDSSLRGGDYETPYSAELRVPTYDRDPAAAASLVVSWLEAHGVLARDAGP